jgi:hypothetical protein
VQPLPGVEHVVVDVATPRQPDAAVDHRQLAGPRADLQRPAASKLPHGAVRGLAAAKSTLHIHDESPIRWTASWHHSAIESNHVWGLD